MAAVEPLVLPPRRLQWIVTGLLGIGLSGLDPALPLSWPTIVLVAMAALKLREARSRPERRLVALLQLVGVGLLGAQQPDLLPSALQLLITVGALAGLLQLELDLGLSWRQLVRRSAQVLAAALPMALVLFLLLPRIGPLWTLPQGWGGAAVTGLSDRLDPGGIASLASSGAPAARVAFSDNRVPPESERYWRVLVHDRFDGRAWQRRDPPAAARWRPPAGAEAEGANQGKQLWLVEPSRFQAVPWDGRAQPRSEELRLRFDGELLLERPPRERRNYQLSSRDQPAPWQRWPPTPLDRQLPVGSQPRLEALGRSWRALPDPLQRVAAAEAWFRGQPFRYSRTPGTLPERAGLDAFLFERQEGFCGHYASTFTALMRAADVPARVVSGYRGGTWVQPLGSEPYLDIRQAEAHAWSEVWLDGRGWVRVDPTTWVAQERQETAGATAVAQGPAWWRWGQRQWWGLDLSWSRWWLGFDQEGQAALLERLLGPKKDWLGPLVLAGLGSGLALGLAWMQLAQGPRDRAPRGDRARRELQRSLRALRSRGLEPTPGEALEQFCNRAGAALPALAVDLQILADAYLNLRYADKLPRNRLDRTNLRRLVCSSRRISRQSDQRRGSA
ncbi:MAG: transglutaminaseTgpA domain-containing protein [Synechococcus sp.]